LKLKRHVDIDGHLVLPFGTATKADIARIRLARVDAQGIRLESEVPVVHIHKSKKEALKLTHFFEVFTYNQEETKHFHGNEPEGLAFIKKAIKQHNPSMTKYEELFIDLYFDRISHVHFAEYRADENVADPLEEGWHGYETNNNFRVDYGFWNGKQLIAVEIDGAEPEGYARDIRRDRMLRRAGVDVIHILNLEIEKHREHAVFRLLPYEFWGDLTKKMYDPFDVIPF